MYIYWYVAKGYYYKRGLLFKRKNYQGLEHAGQQLNQMKAWFTIYVRGQKVSRFMEQTRTWLFKSSCLDVLLAT